MKKHFIFLRIMVNSFLSCALITTSACKQDSQTFNKDTLELANQKVKTTLKIVDGFLFQEFYAAGENGWELIVSSRHDDEYSKLPLYNHKFNEGSRYLLSNIKVKSIQREEQKKRAEEVKVIGELYGAVISFSISLGEEDEHFHIEVESNFSDPNTKVEYVLSDFLFHSNAAHPEFVHTPALKFQEEDIIGDRTFWSPAIILQQKSNFAALVPDLNMINEYQVATPGARPVATGMNFSIPIDSGKITFPTGFDLRTNMEDKGTLFSFGYIDALASHHMHWVHPNNSSMVREVPSKVLKYGFDLFLGANVERFTGYQQISKYLWEQYGSEEFEKGKGLGMPFDEYARLCYKASKNYRGSRLGQEDGRLAVSHTAPDGSPELDSWLDWEINGVPVGGYRNNAPQWYEMIGNTTWWNNARDAVGMFRWGKVLDDSVLLERSRKVINLSLQAPQKKGVFPVIFNYSKKKWIGNHWSPPKGLDSTRVERYFNDESESYHTSSMSKTAVHLLRYYLFCEEKEEIVPYVERYADFLIENMDHEGCVPSFFNSDLTPNPHLQKNGAGGVHAWFLATLYQVTQKQKYLNSAKKAASYLKTHVLPNQDWKDFEVYFSCGVKPLSFHDNYTGQGPRNTLSMHWALEGFLALFEATNEEFYLEEGALVADYLALYQTTWQPHFITTAYAFGGFGVQNTDAEWLDARQGEIAPAFVRLGTLTGRKDLIQRGIAAAKSSLVLINHERHIKNDIYAYPNFPLGLGPENIDHEGRPQSPMRTNAGWGEVSGLSGIADILYQIGDLYIDPQNEFAVGVNGIRVSSYSKSENNIKLKLENTFSDLAFPYTDTLEVEAKIGLKNNKQLPKVSIQKDRNIVITNIKKINL